MRRSRPERKPERTADGAMMSLVVKKLGGRRKVARLLSGDPVMRGDPPKRFLVGGWCRGESRPEFENALKLADLLEGNGPGPIRMMRGAATGTAGPVDTMAASLLVDPDTEALRKLAPTIQRPDGATVNVAEAAAWTALAKFTKQVKRVGSKWQGQPPTVVRLAAKGEFLRAFALAIVEANTDIK